MSEKFIKLQKTLRGDFLFLGILSTIVGLFTPNIFNILYAGLLFICAYCAGKGKFFVGIVGIIIAFLMILTIFYYDIIDAVLGIILLIHSVKYLKSFPGEENAN